MTARTDIEQERAKFEAWYETEYPYEPAPLRHGNEYFHLWDKRLFNAYQAGRATLQSQDREDAERWRKWLPWMRNLNRKPYNLAVEIDAIDHARRIEGETK